MAVERVPEQLPPVEPAGEQLRDLPPRQSQPPEDRLGPLHELSRRPAAVRELQLDGIPGGRDVELDLDDVGSLERGGVDHDDASGGRCRCERPDRRGDDPLPDLLGLGEPGEDLVHHRVLRAAADRVVGRVVDDATPGELEQAVRPRLAMQRGPRLGVALERPFRARRGHLDVDPGRGDVHQHVCPRRRPELAGPERRDGRIGLIRVRGGLIERLDVTRQGLDPDHDVIAPGVGLVDDAGQGGGGHRVIGPVHGEDRPVAVEGSARVDIPPDLLRQPVRDREEIGAVAIAADEVLGADRRSVR